MDDTQKLLVSLEGRFSQYEKNFDKAIRKTDSNFRQMEKRAKESADKMDSIMSNAFKGMATGITGALAGIGFEQIVQRVADDAKKIASIGDAAKRAGLSSKAFQELGFVASQNRIEIDSLVDGFKELKLRADEWIVTGKGSAAEAFQRLGYSADELKAKLADPAELFADIIERVRKLDSAAQIRIFDEIFGGTGGEKFVQLIDRGADSIRRTVKEARDLGLVLDDDVIAKADEIDRKFDLIATTVSTKLKGAIVETVSELMTWQKSMDQINTATSRRYSIALLEKYKQIEDAKEALDQANYELAQDPDNPTAAMNADRLKSNLEDYKKEAMEIRDVLDRLNGYDPDAPAEPAGKNAKDAKPAVDALNSSLTNSNDAATTAAAGLKTYADAIRALRNEVPALAADIANLDARSRIDATYRAALQKARTMGEVYQANELRGEALNALDVKSAVDNPAVYLKPFLAAGKTSMSLTGMNSQFSENLAKMFAAAPADVRGATEIFSGFRSIERQQQLWAEALAKYGSPQAARKWVAPPGNSQHNKGYAADLAFQSPDARRWFHDNASQFGLSFPLGNEPWHIEDAGARQQLRSEDYQRREAAMTQQADAYRDIIANAREHIATQGSEAQALTMTEQAAARFRYEQQMLAEAQRSGITLTDQQRAEISKLAAGMAGADASVKTYVASQQQAAEVSRFFGEQAVDSLTGMITGTMTAADAMRNLTSAIVRAALQAAILGEGPFASLFGGKSSTPSGSPKAAGGLLGALFGFSDGGFTGLGGKHEPAGVVHRGEYVMSAKATRRLGVANLEALHSNALRGFASGGYVGDAPAVRRPTAKAGSVNSSQAITINAPVTVNTNGGGTPQQNADLATQMRRELEGTMRGVVVSELQRQMKPGNMLSGRR